MSYYNIHPFLGHRATQPHHHAATPSASPYHPLARPTSRHAYHTTGQDDLEEEERAAIAHLRSIQQRREAQQAAIQREAAVRLRVEEEREAAIRRAIAEKKRERAIAEAIERQREQALAEAIERERVRSAIIEQHRRRQEAELRQRQHLIELQRQQRAAQIQAAQQLRQRQIDQAVQRKVECAKRCAAKYAQRVTQHAAKEVKKEYKDEYASLNNLLGSLFGINLADAEEKEEKKEEVKEDQQVPATGMSTCACSFLYRADANDYAEVKHAAESSPAATRAPASNEPSAFPEDVNDLLTQFLGLRIEPTTATEASKSDSASPARTNSIPQGLNEFLSRFGLVFEPLDVENEAQAESAAQANAATPAPTSTEQDKVDIAPASVADPPEPTLPAAAAPVEPAAVAASAAASSSSASSSQPRARPSNDDHPLTAFLNGVVDMPPFVRDILGNVEMAFREERDRSQRSDEKEAKVEGKGKAVAEGEKKARQAVAAATPAPDTSVEASPASAEPVTAAVVEPAVPPTEPGNTSAALSTLSGISSELDLVRRSFDFPSTLSFASSPSTDSAPPALLFNKANSGYHAQTHKLLQLLLAADAINSGGNKEVRRKRKEVVREVEKEIEALEKRRDQVWEEVKAKLEAGEEVEPEQASSASTSSCSSSVADPSEVKEVVEHEAEGFEVPAASAEAGPEVEDKPAESATPAPVATDDAEVEEKKEDKAARVEKEDEYELL